MRARATYLHLRDRRIAEAARNLIKAMDLAEPRWRETTLNAGENGDGVNAAWDALVEAVEGGR